MTTAAGPRGLAPRGRWTADTPAPRSKLEELRLVAANDAERTTYVATGGRLVALPEGLQLLVSGR